MSGSVSAAALAMALAVCAAGCARRNGEGESFADITVAGRSVRVELADTPARREQGLMFRDRLPADEGMLFAYANEQVAHFWMKNTRIPLSIAFISADGIIESIQDMQPYSTRTHASRGLVLYALEMNHGWFARNGVREGARVEIPPSVAARLWQVEVRR